MSSRRSGVCAVGEEITGPARPRRSANSKPEKRFDKFSFACCGESVTFYTSTFTHVHLPSRQDACGDFLHDF